MQWNVKCIFELLSYVYKCFTLTNAKVSICIKIKLKSKRKRQELSVPSVHWCFSTVGCTVLAAVPLIRISHVANQTQSEHRLDGNMLGLFLKSTYHQTKPEVLTSWCFFYSISLVSSICGMIKLWTLKRSLRKGGGGRKRLTKKLIWHICISQGHRQ